MTPPPNVSVAFFGFFCVNLSIVAIVALLGLLLCEKQFRVNARKKREHTIVQDKSEYIPVSHHNLSQREMILQQKLFQTQARLPQKFRPQKEASRTEVFQKEASQKEIPLKEVPQKEEKCLKNLCVASIHVEAKLKKGSYSQDEMLEDMRLKEEEIDVQQEMERYTCTESIQVKMAVMQRLIAERERLIAKRNRLIEEEKKINSRLHNLFIAKLILVNKELYTQRCRQEKLLYLLETLNQDKSDMVFRREVCIGVTRRMLNDPQSRIVDLLRERSSVFKIKILEFKGGCRKNRDGNLVNGTSVDENEELLIF